MKEMTCAAVVENIPRVTAFVEEAMEEAGASAAAVMQMDVAVDEIFSNIARYAYGLDTGDASVQCSFEDGTFVLTFRDSGAAFNPLESAEPDVTLPAAERQIGGLGIFLTRKLMDRMSYAREGNENVLRLEKRL